MAEVITVCPECDSSNIRSRVRTSDYRCGACKHTFDYPAEREKINNGGAGGGTLLNEQGTEPEPDADPEPGDEAEASMEDQDQYRESPTDPEPENPDISHIEGRNTVDRVPEPQGEAPKDRDPGCQCCGVDVDTTRNGLCYGCELSGCDSEGSRCKHRSSVH